MATFHDKKQDKWLLEITVGDIKRLRAARLGGNGDVGLDLLSITEVYDADTKQAHPPLSFRLENDLVLLIDVIYCLVEEQATKREVTSVDFGTLMDPESLMGARKAFWDAVRDFFQIVPRGKEKLETLDRQFAAFEALGGQKEEEEAVFFERVNKTIEKNRPTEEEAQKAIDEALQSQKREPSLSGRPSLESIQMDSARVN